MDTQSDGGVLKIVDELARVLYDSEEAKALVLRAGFPSADLPAFSTPRSFWSQVVRASDCGKLANGVQALLDEAAKQYPANPVFADSRVAPPEPGPIPSDRVRYRTKIIDESSSSQPKLLLMDPVCEHNADHQWQIKLSVAFRRHRVFPSSAASTNLAFAAAGAWITADAESSEIVECSAEPSRQAQITPTKTGATRAEWSCDPQRQGPKPGFLEGNEMLLLTFRASRSGSLTTCGRTAGIVFVDVSGNPIRSDLKNMALRIKLWNLKLTLPGPHEAEARHRILVIPDHDGSE
jgi:hypothetical protein